MNLMKFKAFLLPVVATLALSACLATDPIKEPTTSTTGYSASAVRNAILAAGKSRHWIMTPSSSHSIDGKLIARDHVANIRIDYSASSYTIHYVSSENLDDNHNGKIHPNYNRWINNLDRDIQYKLAGHK